VEVLPKPQRYRDKQRWTLRKMQGDSYTLCVELVDSTSGKAMVAGEGRSQHPASQG
jgi:hypothetical protein